MIELSDFAAGVAVGLTLLTAFVLGYVCGRFNWWRREP